MRSAIFWLSGNSSILKMHCAKPNQWLCYLYAKTQVHRNWNPNTLKNTLLELTLEVDTIPAGALAHYVTRTSEAMGLTTEDKRSIHRVTLSSFWPIYASANVVYFSISHTCDHVYMLITEDHPPDIECAVMAVFLLVFMLAQSIMVTFTAVNSFYMVVMEKRFDLGRYDWRLLLMAFGLPLVVMAILAGLGMLGPTGGWWAYHCFIYILWKYQYHRKLAPRVFINLVTMLIAFAFVKTAMIFCPWKRSWIPWFK